MVNIIPRRRGFAENLGLGISQSLPGALEKYGEHIEKKEAAQAAREKEERDYARQLGLVKEKETARTQEKLNFLKAFGVAPGKEQEFMNAMNGEEEHPGQQGYTADQEMAIDLIAPDISKGMRERERAKQKKFEADRSYHTGISNKYLGGIETTSAGIPEREIALDSALSAVQSGQMTPLGGDYWSKVLHIPGLASASGAAVDAAAKVNLIGSLSRLSGGRPNQFIERQISDAFAKAGETKEAQMTKLLMSKAVLDIDKAEGEVANKIAEEDRKKYGYAREDISSRVKKEMLPIKQKIQEKLAYDLREQVESDIGREKLEKKAIEKVPSGTPLTPTMAEIFLEKVGGDEQKALKLAKKLGYTILPDEFYEAR